MSHAPEKPPMLSVEATPEQQAQPARCALATGSASVFPTGEARAVNVGTARKPCWVIEGPKPSAADIQWARDLVDAVHPISRECGDSSSDCNRYTSPVGESNTGTLSPLNDKFRNAGR
jgi:hypothetical protein